MKRRILAVLLCAAMLGGCGRTDESYTDEELADILATADSESVSKALEELDTGDAETTGPDIYSAERTRRQTTATTTTTVTSSAAATTKKTTAKKTATTTKAATTTTSATTAPPETTPAPTTEAPTEPPATEPPAAPAEPVTEPEPVYQEPETEYVEVQEVYTEVQTEAPAPEPETADPAEEAWRAQLQVEINDAFNTMMYYKDIRSQTSDALSEANSQLNSAYERRDAAQQKLDEYNNSNAGSEHSYEEGSFGFFEYVGAADALDVLNNAQYASSTVKGDPTDATSLDNMRRSFDYMRKCNELRKAEGVGELLVSDRLMAISQSNLNWSDGAVNHSSQFYVGENLSWNYADPFTGWYDDEKAEQGGHYLNIINGSYGVTGFAVCTAGRSQRFSISYGQVFDFNFNDGTPLFTVDEYEKRFNEYCDSISRNGEERNTLVAELNSAESDISAMQGVVTQREAEYQQACADYDAASAYYEQKIMEAGT